MDQQQTVADIEKRADELRVSISFVCQRAGLPASTFHRWKKSAKNRHPVSATFRSVQKIFAALDEIAAEDRRRRAKSTKAVAA